jgi:ABC-type transport system substrate-binding protein
MPNGRASVGVLAALAGNAALLGFVIVQLHGVEQRLVVQGQQIRSLGEATERLGSRPAAAAATTGAPPETEEVPAHLLHPEVPNLLKPRDKRWPAPGLPLGGTLVRGWASGDPKGFNSIVENSADLSELIETFVTMPLAMQNVWTNPNEWHGELATRVEVTDDFKEFTLYLRHGVKWHVPANVNLDTPKYAWLKGEHPFTARDIVFTFDMIVNPQVENGFLKSYYSELESVKAIDDYTVVVRWKKKQYLNVEQTLSAAPIPRFLYAFDEDGHEIPKETVGLRLNQHWYNNKGYVGVGPYRLSNYEAGQRIRLVANEDFYGDKPAIKEILYPIYTDPNQTLLKLKAHELSAGGLTPGQYREELKQYDGNPQKPKGSPFFDGRIQNTKMTQPAYSYIGWNADRPLFADKRVRRAMTMAFNRRQIIDSVFVGLGKISTGPFLSSSPYIDPEIKPIPFDLNGAKALLAEAGWTDTDGDGLLDNALRPGDKTRAPFEFTLLIYGSSKEYASLANILKEDLLKIGIKMNIDAAEWSLMQKRMNEKNFDAYTGGWALPWEADLFQLWHSSQADVAKGSNRVGFRNKDADAIIEKLRVTFDADERIALLRRFHRLLDVEQPYSFFREAEGIYCYWNDVKNVEFAKVRPVINTLPWAVTRGAQ